MGHGRKLGSGKGGLDILVAAGQEVWWFGYPWALFRKS